MNDYNVLVVKKGLDAFSGQKSTTVATNNSRGGHSPRFSNLRAAGKSKTSKAP